MFLFGMMVMETAIRNAAGVNFKNLIKRSTATTGKAIAAGAVSTAVLQSSSVLSLMVLAFVGAGVMELRSGIGVIFGANIGSTATSWIVVLLGFKVKIDAFAMPMIGLGGLGLIFFGGSKKASNIFRIITGFGLLFLGLDYMKESMSTLADTVDIQAFKEMGPLVFLGIGFALTALIQSSAASMVIILSALGAGIIDFSTAAATVIGANVGTTATAMLGAVGGSPDKKRVALAHVLFNILTGVAAFALLQPLSWVVLDLFRLGHDPVMALALFHTLFNVLGVLLLFWTIPRMALLLQRLFTRVEAKLTKYIDDVAVDVGDAAIDAVRNESVHFFRESLRFILLMLNIPPADVLSLKKKSAAVVYGHTAPIDVDVLDQYRKIKELEGRIIDYSTRLGASDLGLKDSEALARTMRAVREITFAAKAIKDIKHNLDELALMEDDYLFDKYNHFRHRVAKLVKNVTRILEEGVEEASVAKVTEIFRELEEEDAQALGMISRAIRSREIDQHQAPTLLNVNRAVYETCDSVVEAVKLLFLATEEQKAMERMEEARAPLPAQVKE